MTDPKALAAVLPAGRRQRPDTVTCGWCEATVTVAPTGRVPSWCSPACRHRAWEQQRAAASGRAAVQLVERIVHVEVTVPVVETVEVVALPKGRGWADAMGELARQINAGLVYNRDLPAIATELDQVITALRRRPGLRSRRNT